MRGRPIYHKDDAYRWLAMYQDGMTHEAIGLEEGVHTPTVGKWLRSLPEYEPRTNTDTSPRHSVKKQGTPGSRIPKAALSATRGHRRRGKL